MLATRIERQKRPGYSLRKLAAESSFPCPASNPTTRKGATVADAAMLMDLDQRIAIARDNIRELTEQAAAFSGAGDESRAADRIAEQEQLLATLLREREALAG